MQLQSIMVLRGADDTYTGRASFGGQQGNVTVDLSDAIVQEMLTIYDKAITDLAEQIAGQLVADSVKRKSR